MVAIGAAHQTVHGSGTAARDIVSSVQDMYSRYPFPPPQRKHTYRAHAAYVHHVLDEMGINPEGKIFGDIACGTGLMMLDYALEFPATEFVGYDISPSSVELANHYLQEAGITRARSYVKNIMELDDVGRFTYIVSWGTVHHLPDPREAIRLLSRALVPGGVLRIGVYGYYGNEERRIQQAIVQAIINDDMDFQERIQAVRDWITGDERFRNDYTAPPVDVNDDNWVVDEFLHVWEQHLKLGEVVCWLEEAGLRVLRLTDYYDREISLDIGCYSTNPRFIERVRTLPFATQCHLIELMVRPYWLSLFAQKV
jgi:SAM-dependent methyltransferase